MKESLGDVLKWAEINRNSKSAFPGADAEHVEGDHG
jgi:hypothetical protein